MNRQSETPSVAVDPWVERQRLNELERKISLGTFIPFDPDKPEGQNSTAMEMHKRGPQSGELVRTTNVGVASIIETVGKRVFTLSGPRFRDEEIMPITRLQLITVGDVPCWKLLGDGAEEAKAAHGPHERPQDIIFDPSKPEEEQDPVAAEMYRRGPKRDEVLISGGICGNGEIDEVRDGIVYLIGSQRTVEVSKIRPVTCGWAGQLHAWYRVED